MENKTSFDFEDVNISSEFDSGNLARAEKTHEGFNLWIHHDSPGTTMSSWFYFRIETSVGTSMLLTIKNLARIMQMLKSGLRPVVKTPESAWERISAISYTKGQEGTEISFTYTFEHPSVYFAFTYPWSNSDNQSFLDSLDSTGFYYERHLLAHSVENRDCEVLVVTSNNEVAEDCAYGWKHFPGKETVIVSSRVHPGETPCSFVMNGLLKFLFSSEPEALALRAKFVFLLIPVLNPDGVYHGLMRYDTLGQNLNRCYVAPDRSTQPTIFTLKNLLLDYRDSLYAFIDLHAHMVIKGIFMFGNHLNDFTKQLDCCAIPRLMTFYDTHFHWGQCNFSDAGMNVNDKRGESKGGCGRVAIYKDTGLARSYTLECNYHSGLILNTRTGENQLPGKTPVVGITYTPEIFENTGKALGLALLHSTQASLSKFRVQLAQEVAKTVPYRYYNSIKKAGKSFETMETFLSNVN